MQSHIVKAFDAEINTLNQTITTMAKTCEEQLRLAALAFNTLDMSLAEQIIKDDRYINRFEREIEENCVRILARRQPLAEDLRYILAAMKMAAELERIGDYAGNIAKRVTHISKSPSQEVVSLICEMANLCRKMLTDVMDSFHALDIEKAIAVWHQDNEIDKKFARTMTLVRKQMLDDAAAVDDATQLIFIGRCCERIGDHITNMAEDIYYIATGKNYMDRFEC
ncbi:MAG: phosphate signaling complex protein PhoU [Pseudomonadota bacterium]